MASLFKQLACQRDEAPDWDASVTSYREKTAPLSLIGSRSCRSTPVRCVFRCAPAAQRSASQAQTARVSHEIEFPGASRRQYCSQINHWAAALKLPQMWGVGPEGESRKPGVCGYWTFAFATAKERWPSRSS